MSDKWKEFFSKKDNYFILLLVGVLILVVLIPTKGKDRTQTQGYLEKQSRLQETTELLEEAEGKLQLQDDYVEELKLQLKNILETMDGVEKVNVMITLKHGATNVCEEQGDGLFAQTREKVVTTEYPKVEGVLLIANYDENRVSVKDLTEAVCALFDLEVHKVKVLKGK